MLGCRRAGVRRAEVGARWRCRTWSSGCVWQHEQREARGGVVEDDDVERWSGAAASAALVVQHDGQRAADPLPNTDPDPLPAVAATEKGWEETFFSGASGCVFGSVFPQQHLYIIWVLSLRRTRTALPRPLAHGTQPRRPSARKRKLTLISTLLARNGRGGARIVRLGP